MKTKKLEFRTHFKNHAHSKTDKAKKPSDTIVGQTYTIKELHDRATQVGQIPIEPSVQNYLDQDLEKINKFYKPPTDLTDLDAHRAHLNALNEMLNKANKIQKQRLKEAETAATRQAEENKLNSKRNEVEPAPKAPPLQPE